MKYLKSVHIGEFVGKTMAKVAEDIQKATDNNSCRFKLTAPLSDSIPIECGEDCCDHLCDACKVASS